jgi:hypothetical protein
MLWSLIFMCAQIDNATATRQPVARRVSRREVTASHASSVQKDVTIADPSSLSAGQAAARIPPALSALEGSDQWRHSQEIVFLVDTPVEIENGFSPSGSTTSPKLSRYTFDMLREREKRTEKEACRACLPHRRALSAPIYVTSRCNIGVPSNPVVAIVPSFSRHACREKSPITPAPSTKPPKLLDTLCRALTAPTEGNLEHTQRAYRK